MNKRLKVMIALISMLILFSACTGSNVPEETAEPVYKTISPEEAKALIGREGVLLVDVRTPEEYAEGYIPQAVLLPQGDIQETAQSVLPDKHATIIVYCRSGRRSAIAAEELLDMGYKDVYDLGGILDWPFETTK